MELAAQRSPRCQQLTALPCPLARRRSLSEARAYCRAHGGRVMSESEYEAALASAAAASGSGAGSLHGLEGGGWEWTDTPLAPLPGEMAGRAAALPLMHGKRLKRPAVRLLPNRCPTNPPAGSTPDPLYPGFSQDFHDGAAAAGCCCYRGLLL